MAKVTKEAPPEEVERVLAEALALMNNQGAHWVQGKFKAKSRKTGEVSYCAIGAIRELTKPNTPLRKSALVALAKVVPKSSKWSVYATNTPIEFESSVDSLNRRIWTWNDNPDTTWTDVKRTFAKARSAVKRKIK